MAANIIGLWDAMSGSDLAIVEHRCVRVRNRNVGCNRCAQACTTGCIGIEEGRLVLHPDRCIGCGSCATVCPSGAIEPRKPGDVLLGEACLSCAERTGGTVIVACANALEHAEKGDGVQPSALSSAVGVDCLGRVDESLLVTLAGAGVAKLVMAHGTCEACPRSHGGAVAANVAQTANELLEAWGFPQRVNRVRGFSSSALAVAENAEVGESEERPGAGAGGPSAVPATLKSMVKLGGMRDKAQPVERMRPVPGAQVIRVQRDGTLPHYVPERRARLLDVLRAAGDPDDVELETRLWGCVSIDEHLCTSCRMCTVFCPSGALARFETEQGSFGVEHSPALCVKCGSCADLCTTGALTLHPRVSARDLVSGAAVRYEMAPPAYERIGPHSATNAMRHILNTPAIYER